MKKLLQTPLSSYASCLVKEEGSCRKTFKTDTANFLPPDSEAAKQAGKFVKKAYSFIVKHGRTQEEVESKVCRKEKTAELCKDAVEILVKILNANKVEGENEEVVVAPDAELVVDVFLPDAVSVGASNTTEEAL